MDPALVRREGASPREPHKERPTAKWGEERRREQRRAAEARGEDWEKARGASLGIAPHSRFHHKVSWLPARLLGEAIVDVEASDAADRAAQAQAAREVEAARTGVRWSDAADYAQ